MSKPTILKGTRDFHPQEVMKRKYIFGEIEKVFQKYGFLPIETPSMESLSTLLGKYGDEGDKLIFKVLNNGDFLKDANKDAFLLGESLTFAPSVAKRGMRYDLTVPFARFVVMNQSEIKFPFKRYQIQPVWRADNPQAGRYQEFYQCDVDVVGSDSLLYEAELACIYNEVLNKLGIKSKIYINNRKLLFGLAQASGIEEKFVDMTVAIDKLDKIGVDGVAKEMVVKGISQQTTYQILSKLSVKSPQDLTEYFSNSEEGLKGIEELKTVFNFIKETQLDNLIFDLSLARGLSYYTGCIFEVKVDTESHPTIKMGSIGGGGRYDNLTGNFGLSGVSGVGVSFGAERIYDVMNSLNLFPEDLGQRLKLIFLAFDEKGLSTAFKYAQLCRKEGIKCDVYPEAKQMKKQMKYANDRGFEYVALIGDDELLSDTLSLKNMVNGEQNTITIEELIRLLK